MTTLLQLALNKKLPTDLEIAAELYEICDNVHAGCNDACPVYAVYHEVPDTIHDFEKNRGCDCFKNGQAMLAFLRKHQNKS